MSANTPTPGTYVLDKSHTSIEFVARHMMVTKVKGRFADFDGSIVVGEDNEAHSVSVEIDASSLDTRDETRDAHLRGADFLDVDNFKQVTFSSTGVTNGPGDTWKLNGELTIKGVTRPVTLNLEYTGSGKSPYGIDVAGFEASTEISREDFGLTWNVALETGGVLVGDKIKINIDVEAHKQVVAESVA